MFYALRLRAAMLSPEVIEIFGAETANAVGRAISHAGTDWKSLIKRLSAKGLSPKEGAAVAAAWLASHATPDRLGFDLSRAMRHSCNVIYGSIFDAQMWDRHSVLQEAMKAEGLDTDEDSSAN